MDLAHLRYAVEIAHTHSISQAAENLYMGQPNLSRAIKDLEEELQVQIFKRTSHGVTVTPEGEEFLRRARGIVQRADEIENIYKNKKLPKQQFSLCGPRASYISLAFTRFCKLCAENRPNGEPFEFYYKETNAMKAISKLLENEYGLAIVRYQSMFDRYFRQLFETKKLCAETIAEFPSFVTLSTADPLAAQPQLRLDQLANGIEILHADPYVPSLPPADTLKADSPTALARRIFVFERASQFGLLEQVPGAFMWMPRLPADLLEKYRLAQRPCEDHPHKSKDVLLYRKGHKLSTLDNLFVTELTRAKRECLGRG